MKATISVLFRKGVPIPTKRHLTLIEGGFVDLGFRLHPVLRRNVAEMICVAADGTQLAEPLYDANCISISADGLRFRGWESGPGGREQMQEWFVRPASKPADEAALACKDAGVSQNPIGVPDEKLVTLGLMTTDGNLTDLGRQVGEQILRDRPLR